MRCYNLALSILLLAQESCSFPQRRGVGAAEEDVEQNLVEESKGKQQTVLLDTGDSLQGMGLIRIPIIKSSLLGNWLGGEGITVEDFEGEVERGENEIRLSQPLRFHPVTIKPVTLGYWNWHWRRK